MGQGGNNILSLLLQLGAHPQRANSALNILDASSAGLEKDSKAMREHTEEMLKATKAQQEAVAQFSRLHAQSQAAVAPLRQMHEAFRVLTPEITTSAAQTDQQANAVQRAALALRSQTAAGAELVGKGLAGLVAGRKAQAGVEAVWETARGIALLAEGTWPPNPAAIMAAGLHFEAAAQYALLAGTGSHRRTASGSGNGTRDTGQGFGGPNSGFPTPNPELAPGAAGASSRFSGSGVVIIRGTQDFENYVAGAVNGAVARGVNVTATSAQRGSPVGH
ncbi:MAG: hypothetical protein ACLQVL_35605 [Terriglobia bacterium]